MSIPEKTTISCPKCKASFTTTIWRTVNTGLCHDLPQKVISGELFNAKCPSCGFVSHLAYDVLYHDLEKCAMIWVVHKNDTYERRITEIRQSKSRIAFDITRIVHSMADLQEKVAIMEAGRDDRIVEIMKYVMHWHGVKESPDIELESAEYFLIDGEEYVNFYTPDGSITKIIFDDALYQKTLWRFESLFKEEPLLPYEVVDSDWARKALKQRQDLSRAKSVNGGEEALEEWLAMHLFSCKALFWKPATIISEVDSATSNLPAESTAGINYCRKCGTKLLSDSVFCHNCGAEIAQERTQLLVEAYNTLKDPVKKRIYGEKLDQLLRIEHAQPQQSHETPRNQPPQQTYQQPKNPSTQQSHPQKRRIPLDNIFALAIGVLVIFGAYFSDTLTDKVNDLTTALNDASKTEVQTQKTESQASSSLGKYEPLEPIELKPPEYFLSAIKYYNGQIIKAPQGEATCPLSVEVLGSNGYYIYLDSLTSSQNDMSFMVSPGKTCEVDVPIGKYEIYYATGENWYGEDFLFGSTTSYYKCDNIFDFYFDGTHYQGWTLELYLQNNGNLDTDRIDAATFPG